MLSRLYTSIKTHLGLLALSISILLSSWILVANKVTHRENYPYYQKRLQLSTLAGEALQVNTNSNDVEFRTTLTVGDGETFFVQLTPQSSPIYLKEKNVKAEFYHVSKLLTVHYTDKNDEKMYVYYSNPITWGIKPH